MQLDGDESESGKAIVSSNSPKRTNTKTENAKIIYNEFMKAGYSENQAFAAIANALHESRLDATIQSKVTKDGKQEESYGLFQINQKSHPEYSVEELKDPVKNTRAMLKIMKNSKDSANQKFKAMTDQKEATEFFMKNFEKPKVQDTPAVQLRLNQIPKAVDIIENAMEPISSITNNYITNVAGSSGSNQYASPYNLLDGEIFYKNAYA